MWTYLTLPYAVVVLAATIAAWTDLRRFRVYNSLTVPLALSGMTYHILTQGWDGAVLSSLGFLVGLGLLIVPYASGLMGAGDVKLLAGIGAWLGPRLVLTVFVATCLINGVLALGLIIRRGQWRHTWHNLEMVLTRLAVLGIHFQKEDLVETAVSSTDRRTRAIPFAVAVPIGIVAAIFYWAQT